MTVTSNLRTVLSVDADGDGVFTGAPAPEQFGRVYGGQFLAQALAAAGATVAAPKSPHSMHGYFVRAGRVDRPTRYQVEEVREGRSFAVRSVVGSQAGSEVFRLTASFHAPETGLTYHRSRGYPMVDVAPPSEEQPDYPTFAAGHPDFDPEGWDGGRRPMEMRYINPPDPAGGEPVEEPQLMWVRLRGLIDANAVADTDPVDGTPPAPAPAETLLHAAGLAYLADGALIDHALLPHGLRWFDRRLTGASLDHAMWFHQPVRADDWLLYDQRVEWTGAARGLVSGRFYDQLGNLVTTCTQEGLMRLATEG